MNTVLLPVFRRPEFFYFLAESLKKARGASKYRYLVAAEHGFDERVLPILKDLQDSLGTEILDGAPQGLSAIGLGDYRPRENDAFRGNWYVSLGPCIPKGQFERFLLPHCGPEYYRDLEAYSLRNFPESELLGFYPQQAGLIRRVRERHRLVVLRPARARVMHIGVYGQHNLLRDRSFHDLALTEKIGRIREWLRDPSRLNELGTYTGSWSAEEDHRWDRLDLVNPDYRYAKPSLPESVRKDIARLAGERKLAVSPRS